MQGWRRWSGRLVLPTTVVACLVAATPNDSAPADRATAAATASPASDSDHDGLSDDAEVRRYHTDPRRRDTDRDGLRDGEEILRYHTNPRRSDGDHDDLTDGAEVRRYHTDPRRRDTDRDGLRDGEEILRYHTNPLERDSDGDGYGDRAEVRQETDPRAPRSRPGFPGADNTGVPAGTPLSAYTGPSNIRTPNTVIDGKTLGCIEVSAPGVVIRNSRISCPDGFYAVYVDDQISTQTLLTIEDSEITCGAAGTAAADSDITLRRVNIHDCENGLSVNQNVTVEDSYIHDLTTSAEAHPDGIQFAAGHWNGSSYVCCVLDLTIRHNTIYGQNSDGSPANAAIISGRGGDTNILIENNLFAGGGYTLYCEQDAKGTNYRVLNNHFSTRFSAKVGFYGPSTDCSDETQSGNVYHETGKELRLG